MAGNQNKNANKVNPRWAAAASNAVALLPKGKAGANHMSERKFYDAIASFGDEHGDRAATLLHSCAMANLIDANRRRDATSVINDMHIGMSFLTGKKSTRAMGSAHIVVSISEEDEVHDNDETADEFLYSK